ncbi:MAG TPA: hypothetical protein VMW15_10095 [Terracidiphilus sp.]|nr:hypothetical protein [Terracidiphilus sp.]
MMGKQANFVLGWVGLATLGNHNTGDWIFQRLYEMNAVDLPLDQIARNLTDSATRDFAALPVSSAEGRCHFVLGGWHKDSGPPKPFTCVIFNDFIFHPAQGQNLATFSRAAQATQSFFYSIATFQEVKRPFYVFPIGDFQPKTLRSHFSGLKSLMKKGAETAAISAVCRQIALEAARHTTTISRNLISIEMDNKGRVRNSYYSEDGAEAMLIPDILSPQGPLLKSTLSTYIEGDQITLKFRGKTVKPKA